MWKQQPSEPPGFLFLRLHIFSILFKKKKKKTCQLDGFKIRPRSDFIQKETILACERVWIRRLPAGHWSAID